MERFLRKNQNEKRIYVKTDIFPTTRNTILSLPWHLPASSFSFSFFFFFFGLLLSLRMCMSTLKMQIESSQKLSACDIWNEPCFLKKCFCSLWVTCSVSSQDPRAACMLISVCTVQMRGPESLSWGWEPACVVCQRSAVRGYILQKGVLSLIHTKALWVNCIPIRPTLCF